MGTIEAQFDEATGEVLVDEGTGDQHVVVALKYCTVSAFCIKNLPAGRDVIAGFDSACTWGTDADADRVSHITCMNSNKDPSNNGVYTTSDYYKLGDCYYFKIDQAIPSAGTDGGTFCYLSEIPAWSFDFDYVLYSDVITHGGSSYGCIQSHTSDYDKEPGVGDDWEDYWEII